MNPATQASAEGYGATPHVNATRRTDRHAIASHASGLCQSKPLCVAPAGSGGPLRRPRAGYLMTGPSAACLPSNGCSATHTHKRFSKPRLGTGTPVPFLVLKKSAAVGGEVPAPAFKVFEKNRLFGKRSASGRRRLPGSCGQPTHPAGAVHTFRVWSGGLSTAGAGVKGGNAGPGFDGGAPGRCPGGQRPAEPA